MNTVNHHPKPNRVGHNGLSAGAGGHQKRQRTAAFQDAGALLLAFAFLGCLLFSSNALAQSSATSISFQGALNGTGGQPLPNGSYTLTLQFWDHPTSTAASNRVGGTITVPDVVVTGGVASTGIPVEPAWFDGQTRHLGITVEGVNGGQELQPRVLVTAVPYAAYSQATRGITVDSGGRVAIGTTNNAVGGVGGALTLVGNDRGRPALTIGIDSNPGAPPLYLCPVGWDHWGALHWGLFTPYAHPGGYASGLDAIAMYWNGRSLILGARVGADRPLFNVGIGTDTPQSTLDVNGTTTTTVLKITSAREAKQGFALVDAAAILAKVAALPLSTWAYTNAPTIRHLGPVAQDFHAAFGLSDDDQHIATVDADGVALAAIQGLNQKLEDQVRDKDARIAALEERLARLERLLPEHATRE